MDHGDSKGEHSVLRAQLELSSPFGFISSSVSECKIALPSEDKRDDFFHEIAKESH